MRDNGLVISATEIKQFYAGSLNSSIFIFNSTMALLHQRFPVETPQLCVQEVTGFQPYILLEDF